MFFESSDPRLSPMMLPSPSLLLALLPFIFLVRGQFQLFLEADSLPSGVTTTSTCGVALQSTIACDPSFQSGVDHYFNSTYTPTVCTSGCLSSLMSYRSKVSTACTGVVIEGDDITYPATFAADLVLFSYNTYVNTRRLTYLLRLI